LVPVVSLLGFVVAGREVVRLAQDPAWLRAAKIEINFADAQGAAFVGRLETAILLALAGLLGLTLVARWVRLWVEWKRHRVHVVYPDGRRVTVVPGATILETSRAAGIPHASVCGGRGRCSTCRVRVHQGLELLPPPSAEERRVLARVGAPPNVRLACQTRPVADVAVTPLLSPDATPSQALPAPGYLQGDEREVAILFADLRGFTALSENKLPYDVVFVLNQYFRAMGGAVEEAGGRLDKFIGDGVMALFGIDRGIQEGSRRALIAARRMSERLSQINSALKNDLDRPLRIGIGIHAGPVIVGEMGYGPATSVTAIGDAVNTASRLETLTKDYSAELVLSQPVAEWAGVDLSSFPQHEIEIRGRLGSLTIFVVNNAHSLSIAGVGSRSSDNPSTARSE
jgi:adenylate cyclase